MVGCALITGCMYQVYKPRPGDLEIMEAPQEMDRPERIQPEHRDFELFGSLRPFVEVGGTRRAGEGSGLVQVGAEGYLIGGVDDGLSGVDRLLAFPSGGGLLAGMIAYSSHEEVGSRLYLEGTWRMVPVLSVGAGWTLQPGSGEQGPQATLGLFEVNYVRWNWELGQGWSVVYGLSIPVGFFSYRRVLR